MVCSRVVQLIRRLLYAALAFLANTGPAKPGLRGVAASYRGCSDQDAASVLAETARG